MGTQSPSALSSPRPPHPQLAQAKASEIDALLQRLSDVNDEMGAVIGGGSDARAHTLARHRDVLQEYTQVDGRRGGRRGLWGRGTPGKKRGVVCLPLWAMQRVVGLQLAAHTLAGHGDVLQQHTQRKGGGGAGDFAGRPRPPPSPLQNGVVS